MSDNIVFERKAELIRRYGHQWRASQVLRIDERKLSRLVNGAQRPNEKERQKLSAALGPETCERLFK